MQRSSVIGPVSNRAGLTRQEAGSASGSSDLSYADLTRRIREIVNAVIPPDASIAVVSKGDEELVDPHGRRARHFPESEKGGYAGHYPADGSEAVALVEKARANSVHYLLLPQTAFWWVEHYPELARHLDQRYRKIHADSSTCLIYSLDSLTPPEPHLQSHCSSASESRLEQLDRLLLEEPSGVNRQVSPYDLMYKGSGHPERYFRWGPEALRCIELALLTAGKVDITRILDLPCGHGRVLRTLRAAFPEAEVTACDLDRDSVDFCAEHLGAVPVYSDERPDNIELDGPFDIIWCGSLLTHLNDDLWPGWLKLFTSVLGPGAVLVFTTHGPHIAQHLRSRAREINKELLDGYDREGFGYREDPGQGYYGTSLSSLSWVSGQLEQSPGLRLLSYTERGWWGWQDTVAAIRES